MDFFLHETSTVILAELAIFHSIQIRTSLGKIGLVFAHVRHVGQNFGMRT